MNYTREELIAVYGEKAGEVIFIMQELIAMKEQVIKQLQATQENINQ